MKLAETLPTLVHVHRVAVFINAKAAPAPPSEFETGNGALTYLGRLLDIVGAAVQDRAEHVFREPRGGILAIFDEDHAVEAVNAAIRIQEAMKDDGAAAAWRSTIGIAAGEVLAFDAPWGARDYHGQPVERAMALAAAAVSGAILADRATWALCQLGGIASRAGEAQESRRTLSEYQGTAQQIQRDDLPAAIEYREVVWEERAFGQSQRKESEPVDAPHPDEGEIDDRLVGTVRRWERQRGQGFILSSQGEFFYVDRRYVVGRVDLAPGDRVFFTPREALIAGKNRVAGCVIAVGQAVEGRVVRMGRRGFGFVEVADSAGVTQRVFMYLGDNRARVSKGDWVSFSTGENERGPIALHPRLGEPERPRGPRPERGHHAPDRYRERDYSIRPGPSES
ncbi:MAG: hypothetical protein MUF51_10450 [Vicinamibacteria bacterium]|jgi:cold shock CspA family protein|nr:hypothetical protein [Vicinamibacteria bacterium]